MKIKRLEQVSLSKKSEVAGCDFTFFTYSKNFFAKYYLLMNSTQLLKVRSVLFLISFRKQVIALNKERINSYLV